MSFVERNLDNCCFSWWVLSRGIYKLLYAVIENNRLSYVHRVRMQYLSLRKQIKHEKSKIIKIIL